MAFLVNSARFAAYGNWVKYYFQRVIGKAMYIDIKKNAYLYHKNLTVVHVL